MTNFKELKIIRKLIVIKVQKIDQLKQNKYKC